MLEQFADDKYKMKIDSWLGRWTSQCYCQFMRLFRIFQNNSFVIQKIL